MFASIITFVIASAALWTLYAVLVKKLERRAAAKAAAKKEKQSEFFSNMFNRENPLDRCDMAKEWIYSNQDRESW